MFFVPWDYHIKNNDIVNWMTIPMMFVNQWRLPILFVVSGMGTRFALSRKTGGEYIRERFIRLFIPLLAGILIIISPQVYIERLTQGKISGSFIEFYPHFFEGIYPEGNFSWNHLWFLPYLLLMSIIATPLFLNLRKGNNKILITLKNMIVKSPIYLFLFFIPLFVVKLLLLPYFPITRALYNDWYAFIFYSFLFITGFTLISFDKVFWDAVGKIKKISLITGVITFSLLLWLWSNVENSFLISFITSINTWSWILTIFGYSSIYLNNKSKVIRYRNQAVYPFYILHQTIIIVIGYWLMNEPIHYGLKFLIMIIGTFGFSWFIYEFLIKRIPILILLFGVKINKE